MRRAVLCMATCVTASVLVGCAGGEDVPDAVERVPETVALGELPAPITSTAAFATPVTTPPSTSVPEEVIEPIEGQVGETVAGNRLLLIGDSAMAMLTERREGIGCTVLAGLGWQVQIEAENARYLPFADEVIDEVVVDGGADWDVVGLMFGHFLDTSIDEFRTELQRIIDRLSPRAVLLYTITQEDAAAGELNAAIREVGEENPNVVIVDWGAAVAFEEINDLTEGTLPNLQGMGRIVLLTAAALGEPAEGDDGACLESRFTDDSAIVLES